MLPAGLDFGRGSPPMLLARHEPSDELQVPGDAIAALCDQRFRAFHKIVIAGWARRVLLG
jgi:hypothetical protein